MNQSNVFFVASIMLVMIFSSCSLVLDEVGSVSANGDLSMSVSTNKSAVSANQQVNIICAIENVSTCNGCEVQKNDGVVKFAYSEKFSTDEDDYVVVEEEKFEVAPLEEMESQVDTMPVSFTTRGYYRVTFICNVNGTAGETTSENNSDFVNIEVK